MKPKAKKDPFFQRAIRTLMGVPGKVYRVLSPILTSAVGEFLAEAVPVASELVARAARENGNLTDESRQQAVNDLRSRLTLKGIDVGIKMSTGLLRLAVDTAFQASKAQDFTGPAEPQAVDGVEFDSMLFVPRPKIVQFHKAA